jgi:prophage regulatory protein
MTTPKKLKKPALRFISRKEVLSRVPVSYPTLWAMMRRGEFPRSRAIVGRRCVWVESEVEAWIARRPRVRLQGDR